MQINSTLTPANLEALRKAILNEADLANNLFGNFQFSCTAKNLKDGIVNYLIKFTLEDDPEQFLVVSSSEPLPYVVTLLVAPSGGYINRASLYNRFPLSRSYIDRAFEDYQTYLSMVKLQAGIEEEHPAVDSNIRKALFVNSVLTRINFILIIGVIWKTFLH